MNQWQIYLIISLYFLQDFTLVFKQLSFFFSSKVRGHISTFWGTKRYFLMIGRKILRLTFCFITVCVCVCVCLCEGTSCGNWFSPGVWVPGIELKVSDLATGGGSHRSAWFLKQSGFVWWCLYPSIWEANGFRVQDLGSVVTPYPAFKKKHAVKLLGTGLGAGVRGLSYGCDTFCSFKMSGLCSPGGPPTLILLPWPGYGCIPAHWVLLIISADSVSKSALSVYKKSSSKTDVGGAVVTKSCPCFVEWPLKNTKNAKNIFL